MSKDATFHGSLLTTTCSDVVSELSASNGGLRTLVTFLSCCDVTQHQTASEVGSHLFPFASNPFKSTGLEVALLRCTGSNKSANSTRLIFSALVAYSPGIQEYTVGRVPELICCGLCHHQLFPRQVPPQSIDCTSAAIIQHLLLSCACTWQCHGQVSSKLLPRAEQNQSTCVKFQT